MKLNNRLMKQKATCLATVSKIGVLLFDECHRSQFGESFEKPEEEIQTYYQFGFTITLFSQKTRC